MTLGYRKCWQFIFQSVEKIPFCAALGYFVPIGWIGQNLNKIYEEAYDPSLWNHEENKGDEIKIVALVFRYKHVEKRK